MSHSSKSQGGRSSLSTSCLVQREREGIWQYTKFLCSIPVRGRVKTAHQSCVKGRYSERKPERNREGLRERQRKEVKSRKKEVTKLGKGGKEADAVWPAPMLFHSIISLCLCDFSPSLSLSSSLPSLSVCFSRASRSFTVQGSRPNGDWARWLGSGRTLTDAPCWESRYKALTVPRSQFSPYDKPPRRCRPPRLLRYRKRIAGINHCRIYSNKLCKQVSTCVI